MRSHGVIIRILLLQLQKVLEPVKLLFVQDQLGVFRFQIIHLRLKLGVFLPERGRIRHIVGKA